jgi:hypothetical protein
MPLEQVIFSNAAHNKQLIKVYKGQCVLTFSSEINRHAPDVRKIWCEYSDGKDGHALALTNIKNADQVILKDYSVYGEPQKRDQQ